MLPYSQLEPKVNEFPRRRFLGLAGFQVAVGLLFIFLGFVDLGITINDAVNCGENRYYGRYDYEDDMVMPEMREQNRGDFMEGTRFPPMEMEDRQSGDMDDRRSGPPPMGMEDRQSWDMDDRRPRPPPGDMEDRQSGDMEDRQSGDMDDRRPRPPPMDMEERPPRMTNDMVDYYECPMEQYYTSFACAPIWCGIMFIIAGALGLGAARTPFAHRKSGLKIGFMVLCVINVLLCVITLGAGVVEIILNLYVEWGTSNNVFRIAAGGIYITLSLILFIVAIVSAGVACCCAPVEEVKVVYVPQYFQAPQPSVVDTKAIDLGDLSGKTHI